MSEIPYTVRKHTYAETRARADFQVLRRGLPRSSRANGSLARRATKEKKKERESRTPKRERTRGELKKFPQLTNRQFFNIT